MKTEYWNWCGDWQKAPEGKVEGNESSAVFQEETADGGVIRLEAYPDAYWLWYHGELVWKSKE